MAADGSPHDREVGRSAPLVIADSISVTYSTHRGLLRSGSVQALRGVSVEVARAETVALVGESGSGKTTLGRVTLRLVSPSSGRVIFDGRDITRLKDEELGWFRQRAQMVFQDPFSSLNPYMRVAGLIEEPLLIDGLRDGEERFARVRQALEAVELVPAGSFAEKYPTAMSGGQRQRVGIARALVRNPEYVVADEPVSMIDASSRVEILDLLRGLRDSRGVSFLYITHDIASARHFAARIAVMHRGRIVELGPAAAIIDDPRHPYTKALIEAIPEPDPANRFRRRVVGAAADGFGSGLAPGAPILPGCPHERDATHPPDLLPVDVSPEHLVACHLMGAA